MIEQKKVCALIPARGGSKRLPKKNSLPLSGKPLIAWTIEAALNSQYIDKVLVSTDSEEIASISREFGAYVPALRPEYLANDTATTEQVIRYELNRHMQDSDILIILQPTSPLRSKQQIDQALRLFQEKKASSVFSVTACEHPPEWCGKLPDNYSMANFISGDFSTRSQDLQKSFRLNGAIYIYDIR
ncbi:CMP-N-acetlyneuraminic acid synthetase, partial [Salinivibrio kushneri]|uniref:acylneuraminate cytidylyltransferase family protein n=1 Tax=Salinivibrio kushneri TaxID=1908198 RepID=UPI000988F5CD